MDAPLSSGTLLDFTFRWWGQFRFDSREFCAYHRLVQYEWDESKRQVNIAKHGMDFECMRAFQWDTAAIEPSPRDGEIRYMALGYIGFRLRAVIYTERGAVIRIISLRRASDDERDHYAQA